MKEQESERERDCADARKVREEVRKVMEHQPLNNLARMQKKEVPEKKN